MFVTQDGTVTGSIDVSRLDEIEPKTDEARAMLDALKADVKFGQEQTARDAQRLAEAALAASPWVTEAPQDQRDAQGKSTGANESQGLLRVPEPQGNRDAQGRSAGADQSDAGGQKASDQSEQKAPARKSASSSGKE